jgi:hypothetical protein
MNSGIEFALARTYDKFNKKWGLPSEKLTWIKIWSSHLVDCDLNEITLVTDYCESEMQRAPSLPEFIQLASRLRDRQPLSEPIVSLAERMAFLILTSDELSGAEPHHLSDACLIAGAIAHLKSYRGMKNVPEEGITAEFSGRAKMFSSEAMLWAKDAAHGKGYWKVYLGGPPDVV